MDITAFIRELLFSHDCVIVPGFGGFIGNYTPARIDKSTGTFYPPLKQISFNRNLDHNDGLLVGRISKFARINYGDARSMVEEFVSGIRRKLEKGERVSFEKIGSFINNHEGNIQFEPEKNINYLLDSYGLESFQCMPLEGYDVRKRVVKHPESNPLARVSYKKILWRAAVIVPLLSLLVVVKTDLIKTKVEATSMNPLVSAEFESNKTAVDEGKTIKPEEFKPEEEKIPEPAIKQPEAVPVAPPVTEAVSGARPYYIITGSFKSKENAEVQMNMLRHEGYDPEVVTIENGFYRVCALACNDLRTASSKKDSIAAKFPGSWISRKK